MKHVTRISKEAPAQANEIQWIICNLSLALSDLLELKGGMSPVLGFINLKCDLPQPNE